MNQRNRRASRKVKKVIRVPKQFAAWRDAIVPVLEPYGVKRIALFGSVVRGEATKKSDIDILVDFEEPRKKPFGLFAWIRAEEELSKRLGRKADDHGRLEDILDVIRRRLFVSPTQF